MKLKSLSRSVAVDGCRVFEPKSSKIVAPRHDCVSKSQLQDQISHGIWRKPEKEPGKKQSPEIQRKSKCYVEGTEY